jgi:hypothetical protein
MVLCYSSGMEDTPTPPPRNKGGRPSKGNHPTRSAGRHGQIWEECVEQAKADGQDMTAFVRDAITRELDRRRLAAHRASQAAATTYPCQQADRSGCPMLASAPAACCVNAAQLPPELAARLTTEPGQHTAASNPRDPGARHWLAPGAMEHGTSRPGDTARFVGPGPDPNWSITRHPDGTITTTGTPPPPATGAGTVTGIRPWDGTDADLARFRDVE